MYSVDLDGNCARRLAESLEVPPPLDSSEVPTLLYNVQNVRQWASIYVWGYSFFGEVRIRHSFILVILDKKIGRIFTL